MGTAKMGPLIFSMALPAMISMIINALYNIVDSIFVAKYSQDALAAVSLVSVSYTHLTLPTNSRV